MCILVKDHLSMAVPFQVHGDLTGHKYLLLRRSSEGVRFLTCEVWSAAECGEVH